MRKILCSTVVLLALFVSSCKKERVSRVPATQTDETINVKLAANEAYKLDLSNAGAVNIIKQASHFLVSETAMNTVKGGSVYNYTPAKDFRGKDEVVFLSTRTAVNTNSILPGGCYSDGHYDNSVSVISRHIILRIDVGD